MKHIKQLDTIRAIAVIMVIVCHWFPNVSFVGHIPFGEIGVNAFFVLSGFLITKILFESRGIDKPAALLNFYARRTLRIFPIYYISIILLFTFQKYTNTDIGSSFPYFLTYTQNFHFFKIQSWDSILSQFWSLAVEEQFYLIWPFLVLFMNKKYLFHVIIIFILIGVSGQYLMKSVAMNSVLTFNCFDAFGLGALLSWQITYKPHYTKKLFVCLGILSFIFIILLLLTPVYIPFRTGSSVVSAWVIAYVIVYEENLKFKFILNNRVLIFIGKISYGLYLYHNVIPRMLNSNLINIYFNYWLPEAIRHWPYLLTLENAILLLLISYLSFVYIETPFLQLKKHFRYHKYNIRKGLVKSPS